MDSETKPITGQVRIEVSEDRLRAWVSFPGSTLPRFTPPNESQILVALAEQGIEKNEATLARVRQLTALIAQAGQDEEEDDAPREIPERYLIAEGTPTIEPRNGEFEWDESFHGALSDWQGDAPVNYYTLNSILTIDVDTRIGRILPPREGVPGRDVFGAEIVSRRKRESR